MDSTEVDEKRHVSTLHSGHIGAAPLVTPSYDTSAMGRERSQEDDREQDENDFCKNRRHVAQQIRRHQKKKTDNHTLDVY